MVGMVVYFRWDQDLRRKYRHRIADLKIDMKVAFRSEGNDLPFYKPGIDSDCAWSPLAYSRPF